MKHIILLLVSCLLVACSSNPTGTISVRSVEPDGSLKEPLTSSANLVIDDKTIFKTETDGSTNGNDVYTIYLTDAYLKYLADWWGVNEVIFVVEFTEAVTGEADSDITTKILGPYEKLSDGIKAPLLNKALYGPKKMESDLLSMNIKVYEYDLDENDGSSAMLEFIASAAQSFSLSDPVTLGEIKLAKEIANTLLLANENDLVMEMDVDFVAGNSRYITNNQSNILPLKDGQVVIVKQEGCSVMTCYGYFSKGGQKFEGVIPDILMSPFTFINRALTDAPEYSTLWEFDGSELKVGEKGITKQDKLYQDKTWLRLNIVKGGDASQWSFRKKLYPTAEEIEKLLKNSNALNRENIDSILKGINDAQQSLVEVNTNAIIKLTSKMSQNDTHFIEANTNNSSLCISYPENVNLINTTSKPNDGDGTQAFEFGKLSSSKQSSCYNITPSSKAGSPETTFTPGAGDFIVNYEVNDNIKVQSLPYLIREKLLKDDFSLSCMANADNTSYQLVLKPNKEDSKNKIPQITAILFGEANQDIPFTATDSEIKTNNYFDKKASFSIKVEDVFGASIEPSISLADITSCLSPP